MRNVDGVFDVSPSSASKSRSTEEPLCLFKTVSGRSGIADHWQLLGLELLFAYA